MYIMYLYSYSYITPYSIPMYIICVLYIPAYVLVLFQPSGCSRHEPCLGCASMRRAPRAPHLERYEDQSGVFIKLLEGRVAQVYWRTPNGSSNKK